MKKILLPFLFIVSFVAMAQSKDKFEEIHYNVFNPYHMKKEWFVTTNSGVFSTPIGIKVGFISNPGIYLGVRTGIGQVYHSDTDFRTVDTYLYSFTVGLTKPLIINGDFKLVAQLGAGYGQWWKYRWERWTKSGYEIEAGILIQKKSFLFNMTGNLLNGSRTYATGDLSIGIGFVCGCNCK